MSPLVRIPRVAGPRSWGRIGLTAATVSSMAGLVVLTADEPLAEESTVWLSWVSTVFVLVTYGVVAAVGRVVTVRVPRNRVGWMIFVTGLSLLISACCEFYARRGRLTIGNPLPGGPVVAVIGANASGLAAVAFFLAVAWFPTGRSPGQVWRVALWVTVGLELFSGLVSTLRPGPVEGMLTGLAAAENPFGLTRSPVPVGWVDDLLLPVTLPALGVVALSGLIVRLCRAGAGPQRQQLKWALLGVCYAITALPLDPVVGANGLLYATGLVALPLTMGVAMSRHGLYAVDSVINHALRYGVLIVLLVGVYVLVLTAIDGVAREWGAPVVSAAATGVAAVSLMPLYLWVRRTANRITFGIRDDPRQVLRRVGGLLTTANSGGGVLPLVACDLARALRLPYVAIEVRAGAGHRIVATYGTVTGTPTRVPLRYQGEDVGILGFTGRLQHGTLPPGDRQTLTDLVPQIAAAVAALRLTEELQRSAQRLIDVRTAERARIRRDLHDGLGPTLAAIGIQAELARELITQDAAGSARVLTELKRHSAAGVAEVRRIVDDLRPAALERGGLLDALTRCALELSSPPSSTPATGPATARQPPGTKPPVRTAVMMLVHGDGDLDSLPPQVEVAAYRIAVEAMTNAARHSHSSRVDISLTVHDGLLTVQVRDNGEGLPSPVPTGTGLESMRHRVHGLGGTYTMTPGPDGTGTQITARIQIPPPSRPDAT